MTLLDVEAVPTKGSEPLPEALTCIIARMWAVPFEAVTFGVVIGEFVLEPLADGRTSLTGRTWYRLRMAPTVYWSRWTDVILHRVHYRVLDHISRVSEESSGASDQLLTLCP